MNVHGEIATLLRNRTGIDVPRCAGHSLVRFLERRRCELGLESLEPYLAKIATHDGAEYERLVNAVTVTYTWFHRDPVQLEVLGSLIAGLGRSARIWVPGCSTGEDAYGAALIAERVGVEVEILASDVNTEALATAERARYTPWALRDLPEGPRRWFHSVTGGMLELDERIRSSVRFLRHNLLDRPPEPLGGGRWDVILCRNVLIYFAQDQTALTLAALGRALAPDGLILLGSSEIVLEAPPGLELANVGPRLALRAARTQRPPAPRPKPFHPPNVAVRPPHAHVHPEPAARLHAVPTPASELPHADPASAPGLLETGIEQYLAGNVERALEALRSSLFLEPKLWPAAFYLGLCYETLGLPLQALREFRSAVAEAERAACRPDPDRNAGPLSGWAPDLKWLAERRALALALADPTAKAGHFPIKEGT